MKNAEDIHKNMLCLHALTYNTPQIHAAYQFTCVVTQRNSHGRSVTVAFLEVWILFAYPGDG